MLEVGGPAAYSQAESLLEQKQGRAACPLIKGASQGTVASHQKERCPIKLPCDTLFRSALLTGASQVPLLLGPGLHLRRSAQLGGDALQHISRLDVRKALQQHAALGALAHGLHLGEFEWDR